MTSFYVLTNWVDVKKAHGCSEYGVEHAVVQRLRALHQHVEQDQIPDKAEDDGGCRQTCKNQTAENSSGHRRNGTGNIHGGNDDMFSHHLHKSPGRNLNPAPL